MKRIHVAIITLLISSTTYAATTNLAGTQQIQLDNILDGQIIDPAQLNYDFSGNQVLFTAIESASVLAGSISRDEQLIQFQVNNATTGDLRYFSGLFNGTSYIGTWFSNTGAKGDWKLTPEGNAEFYTCREILVAGESIGDGIYQLMGDEQQPYSAYCDMTRDGGGWTLVGTFPKNVAGGTAKTLNDYSSTLELTATNPMTLSMYKGSLEHFFDVKESVSCSTDNCDDGRSVYGIGFSTYDLQKVRTAWAYQEKIAAMPSRSDKPTCQKVYGDPNSQYQGCTQPQYVNYPNTDTLVGWQNDINGDYCWVARGTYASGSLGSARCIGGQEPNGTKWALLWMR
ncbi:fibrinogen-like YCDxxxxGGGW domain-containing protein [Pseudoalteromonas xiamenensis]|uniref:fibrinogen-like YCDxxxxGGGW domain-containing protein n=1 Tax=Pseudoalteromonas xiamenensis TaxID=882626 RepID=UPI0027E56AF7|nr:fibrinogen-like YCDxxxxGGGW domain-containing protein [Pseudoalteromonas xiamenensis]WMN59474.1 fibrinogen-like YCDxxxxGGGW domain-containing protein [Pseudoalteromonas xiamenensis]